MDIIIDETIRTKRRTISITINSDARVIVRAPLKISEDNIKKFVMEKQKWINKTKHIIQNRKMLHLEKKFVDNEEFLYLGKKYKLKTDYNETHIKLLDDLLILPFKNELNLKNKIIEWYENEAFKILKDRTLYLATHFGFSFKSIRITNAKRRWGSCSHKNTINYTWRLIMAPMQVIDYVILHELIHTLEKNHSINFWTKLKSVMPDFKMNKKWLVENQRLLDIL